MLGKKINIMASLGYKINVYALDDFKDQSKFCILFEAEMSSKIQQLLFAFEKRKSNILKS